MEQNETIIARRGRSAVGNYLYLTALNNLQCFKALLFVWKLSTNLPDYLRYGGSHARCNVTFAI